jgi:hypothetical protein
MLYPTSIDDDPQAHEAVPRGQATMHSQGWPALIGAIESSSKRRAGRSGDRSSSWHSDA